MKITGLHLILLLYMHDTATLFATFCVIVVSEAVVGTHGIRKGGSSPVSRDYGRGFCPR